MGEWPLMDGFLHLEDQWPGWRLDGDYWSAFVFVLNYVMYGGDLDWIE